MRLKSPTNQLFNTLENDKLDKIRGGFSDTSCQHQTFTVRPQGSDFDDCDTLSQGEKQDQLCGNGM